jgi:beta-lactamase class A
VDLYATHDRVALRQQVELLASLMDKPATGPRLVPETESYMMGHDGFATDIDATMPVVEAALYDPLARTVEFVVVDEEARPFDMTMLEETINSEVQGFDGLASFYILNLETGEELGVNEDVAISGLSVIKIAILLEAFRAIDSEPNSDQAKLLNETGINSGNYSANLLLDIVAGQDNAYLGVDILTESMQRLGLENTFIVTPYEEPDRPGKGTLSTPANQRQDIYTNPDPTMQTTAEDMGALLSMIYYCAEGGGTLLALYPDQLTPSECQATLDILSQNVEGNLIRFGVPEGVTVAHKHGWAGNTHGDAGIVYSPGADYVIVEYLAQPDTDWLVHDISFPILRELSRAVYNFFNVEAPYFADRLSEELSAEPAPEATPAEGPEAEITPEPVPQEDGGLPPGVEARVQLVVAT